MCVVTCIIKWKELLEVSLWDGENPKIVAMVNHLTALLVAQ